MAMAQAEEDKPTKVAWRTIEVSLTDTAGKPAADVPVDLVGVARQSMYNPASLDEGEEPHPGWHFKTDAGGHCQVRLGRFSCYKAKELTGEDLPGWGTYHLVADAGKAGFVISPRIYHPENDVDGAKEEEQLEQSEARDELGEFLRRRRLLTEDSTPLALQLLLAMRITGMLVDPAGKPLVGHVTAWTDLQMESHTGYGGGILRRETDSDASGKFALEGVYPATFQFSARIDMKDDKEPVWIKTRLRTQWVDTIVDRITPREDEKEIEIRCVIAPESPHLFHGHITGPDGKPLSGAKVTAGISRHSEPLSYSDDHNFESTTSGEDGAYELRASAPYLRFITVAAPGFKEANEDFESSEPVFGAPGEYDFKLEKEGE